MTGRMTGLLALCLLAAPLAAQAQSPSVIVPEGRADQTPPPPRERRELIPQGQGQPGGTPQIAPFTLSRVVVTGSTLPPAELDAAWRPFAGRTIDGAGLERITDALLDAYRRSDVAIYTVLVPGQDFAGGVLRVSVLEGWIESAAIRGGEGGKARSRVEGYVDRLRDERPLRRTSLQRYVSLIRDIPGLRSDMRLLTGQRPEGVRLELDLDPRPVQFGLAVNNRGTAFLGRTQVSADLYLNSLLRGGDQTRVTIAAPTDVERFQYYAVSHATPLGGEGTTLQVMAGHLRTRPQGVTLRGRAGSLGVLLTHPLVRSYDQDLYLSLGVDGLDAENAFLGNTFSDDRTRAARAALAYTWQSDRRLAYLSGTLSVGIDGLGARTADPAVTELAFAKGNVRARYSTYLGDQLLVRLNAAGQWTADRLPPSEQFALGGDEFGRAYEAATVAGDYGLAGSAELAWRPPRLQRMVSGAEAYAFFDGGKVWYRSRLGAPTADARLASAGVGVRGAWREHVSVELEAAKALNNPLPYLDRDDWRGVFAVRTFW
ncbi:MAG: ShlB/FhaC/HecB family hemolysin secretion/activation protein [Phenylobacterium sp.]